MSIVQTVPTLFEGLQALLAKRRSPHLVQRAWLGEPNAKVYIRIGESVDLVEGSFQGIVIANYEGDLERIKKFIDDLIEHQLFDVISLEMPSSDLWEWLLLKNFQINNRNGYSGALAREFYQLKRFLRNTFSGRRHRLE